MKEDKNKFIPKYDTNQIGKRGRIIIVILGSFLNIILAYLTWQLKLPVFLDTIGTFLVSMLGGIVPGLFTAVFTNLFCTIFNKNAVLFTLINVATVFLTAWCISKKNKGKKLYIFIYILMVLLVTGIMSYGIQKMVLGEAWFREVMVLAEKIKNATGINESIAIFFADLTFNSIDKITTLALAFAIFNVIPEKVRKLIWEGNWRQKPVSEEEQKKYKKILGEKGYKGISSLQSKLSGNLVIAALAIATILVWISLNLYYENIKSQYIKNAENAAEFAANVVDADRLDDFLEHGADWDPYKQTEKTLYMIRKNAAGVKYLYILRVEDGGSRYIFDLNNEENEAYELGHFEPFEEAFEQYITALYAGEEIEPVESVDKFGWLLTIYKPIKNKDGKTVGYAGADISMETVYENMKIFLVKMSLIFSGFFILILSYGLSIARYHLFYPISSMSLFVKEFINGGRDQKILDKNVKKSREVGIYTNDEVEELFHNLCDLEANMAEQMRSIRYYSEATAKMQNGLIITMADMVENRDSDTGAHIQKTAEYVRIIVNGLKKKGYYEEKLTPKFMSDVVISAPLHDVGKINVPDSVLNKPGKLTPEEFEIMKTHTTSGMKILEKAIGTVEGESYMKEARNMAAYHHERWDGKGYPEGLHGEVIPLSARIMAVADVFDALTSPRVYKPAFPLQKALEILQEGSGTQFDPKCIEAFMDSLNEVKKVLKKYQEV